MTLDGLHRLTLRTLQAALLSGGSLPELPEDRPAPELTDLELAERMVLDQDSEATKEAAYRGLVHIHLAEDLGGGLTHYRMEPVCPAFAVVLRALMPLRRYEDATGGRRSFRHAETLARWPELAQEPGPTPTRALVAQA